MKAQTITLKIEKPCTEDWNKMIPEEKGKFCQSCEKTVIDFSMMSSTAVVNFFINKPTNICGRFSKYQVNVPLSNGSTLKNNFFNKYVAGALMALGFYKPSFSQPVHAQIAGHEKAIKQTPVKSSSTPKKIIHGKIIDAETSKPIAFAHITLRGTKVSVNSDKNGNYKLTLPVSFANKTVELEISGHGFETIILTSFNFTDGVAKADVQLNYEEMMLKGDVMIMGGIEALPNKN